MRKLNLHITDKEFSNFLHASKVALNETLKMAKPPEEDAQLHKDLFNNGVAFALVYMLGEKEAMEFWSAVK
jgi:hypothetical protein